MSRACALCTLNVLAHRREGLIPVTSSYPLWIWLLLAPHRVTQSTKAARAVSNCASTRRRVSRIHALLLASCASALLAGCGASSEPSEPIVEVQPTSDSVSGSPDEWLAELCTTQPPGSSSERYDGSTLLVDFCRGPGGAGIFMTTYDSLSAARNTAALSRTKCEAVGGDGLYGYYFTSAAPQCPLDVLRPLGFDVVDR